MYLFGLWNLVIRPPRLTYTTRQLGPREFTVAGVAASRRDVCLRTPRGTKLECSHYVPLQDSGETIRKIPVVIYLHGNSSSRLEAANLVGTLISQRISLFCFDAAGCGLSEGEYVSLGWYERDDLAMVIEYLRQSPVCGPLGIWGRSMGAATALLHADRDSSIGAMLLDSPFADFGQLAEELLQHERMPVSLPGWLVGAVLELMRARIRALADFDVMDLKPIEHARRSCVPALFVHGRDDTLISPAHSHMLFEAYSGDREFITVAGTHNTPRSRAAVGYAVRFFRRTLRLGDMDMLTLPRPVLLRPSLHPRKQPKLSPTTEALAGQIRNPEAPGWFQDIEEESPGFIPPARTRRVTLPSKPAPSGQEPLPQQTSEALHSATDGTLEVAAPGSGRARDPLGLRAGDESGRARKRRVEFTLPDGPRGTVREEASIHRSRKGMAVSAVGNDEARGMLYVSVGLEDVLDEHTTSPAMAERCISRVPPSMLWAAREGGA